MEANAPSPVPEQAPEISQQDALAQLARMAADPFQADALERLREEALAALNEIIREVGTSLPVEENRGSALPTLNNANSFMALKNLSRQRESMGRQRQEVAQALVMGTLFNRNNPDWDPLDPSTDKSSNESIIAALFQSPPPTPGS